MRKAMLFLAICIWSFSSARTAAATTLQAVTLDTTKQIHSATGTWSAVGAFADRGTLRVLGLTESGWGAPTFGLTHVTYEFESTAGTFTLESQIKDTFTSVTGFFSDDGTW